MADLSLVTTGKIEIVRSLEQFTLGFSESMTPGQAARLDTSNGKFTKSNGTNAAEARMLGVLASKDGAGAAGTVVRKGILDGYDLSGLNYDAAVYLSDTDGALADAAGTVSVVVGRVIPGTSVNLGTAYDKLLLVDL